MVESVLGEHHDLRSHVYHSIRARTSLPLIFVGISKLGLISFPKEPFHPTQLDSSLWRGLVSCRTVPADVPGLLAFKQMGWPFFAYSNFGFLVPWHCFVIWFLMAASSYLRHSSCLKIHGLSRNGCCCCSFVWNGHPL